MSDDQWGQLLFAVMMFVGIAVVVVVLLKGT